jgi:hypothetical protein
MNKSFLLLFFKKEVLFFQGTDLHVVGLQPPPRTRLQGGIASRLGIASTTRAYRIINSIDIVTKIISHTVVCRHSAV